MIIDSYLGVYSAYTPLLNVGKQGSIKYNPWHTGCNLEAETG